jgi:hypothetical protein
MDGGAAESLSAPAGVNLARIAVKSGEDSADVHAATFSPSTHTFD